MTVAGFLKRVALLFVPAALSITLYIFIGEDINAYIARYIDRHFIRGVDIQPLTASEVEGLTFEPVRMRDGGSAEHYDIANAYQRAPLPAGERLTWPDTRYRLDWLRVQFSADANTPFDYIVLWPRHCRADGCRYDIIESRRGRSDLIDTIYANHLLVSDYFKNGYIVFADVDGRVFWWNGDRYVNSDFSTRLNYSENLASIDCFQLIEDAAKNLYIGDIILQGRIITDEMGSYFITLNSPTCVDGYSHLDPAGGGPAPINHSSIYRFHLNGTPAELTPLVGEEVRLTGRMMQGMTAHHKTPIVITVSSVSAT